MDRKQFIGTVGTLAAGLTLPATKVLAASGSDNSVIKIPPYLKQGDMIGITSPAGTTAIENVTRDIQTLYNWGFNVKIGASIGKKHFTLGGTDEERLADLQNMLDDPAIKAIMCARGGYGSVRIIDKIKWTTFKKHPKWVIGFSDITVLHNHIHTNCGVASIHSKMLNSFPPSTETDPFLLSTITSIKDALTGKRMLYAATNVNTSNKLESGEGVLVGGNLKTIESLAGSPSDIITDGKILFVEDTGEYLYSIDRMFWNLKRSGKLNKLKGLIIGGFKVKPDTPGDEFGKSVQEIVLEKISDSSFPVCFDFPVGHQRDNFALKCGVKHRLTVAEKEATLTEIK